MFPNMKMKISFRLFVELVLVLVWLQLFFPKHTLKIT
jgi:hypothetical protein